MLIRAKYSVTSMAQTLLAHSPRLAQEIIMILKIILCMIHPERLVLTLARTNFHGSKPVQANEDLQCNMDI